MASTPRQRLADLLLGRSVLDFIAERRADGKTWPQVRDDLCDATDGEIDVSWQAVQQWASQSVAADGAA
jgi:hypothetical protein